MLLVPPTKSSRARKQPAPWLSAGATTKRNDKTRSQLKIETFCVNTGKIKTIEIHPNVNVCARPRRSLRTADCGAFSLRENSKYSFSPRKTEARCPARTIAASRMPTTAGSARCSITSYGPCQKYSLNCFSIKNVVSESQCRFVLRIKQPFPTTISLSTIYPDGSARQELRSS